MKETISELAGQFFKKLSNSLAGHDELKRTNQVIQFDVRENGTFYVDILDGKASVRKEKPAENVGIRFVTDEDTLAQLFQGKKMFTDTVPFFTPPEAKGLMTTPDESNIRSPLMCWVGKLIRTGQELR